MYLTQCLWNSINNKLVATATPFYKKILQSFPGQMSLVFSYGSGIFPQNSGESPTSNMLDFIFVVEDPEKWHRNNLRMNGSHYSSIMRTAGINRIVPLMNDYGAGIYYNTNIAMAGRMIKYGVIGENTLIEDLKTWDKLYVAGRLHKPVHIVHHNFEKSPMLLEGLKTNLISAVLTALIILPETFTELDLYNAITGLSYTGDFRMTFGEDKNKVLKIVNSNFERFQQLYHPVLDGITETSFQEGSPGEPFIFWRKESGVIDQDKSPSKQHGHLNRLPLRLKLQICRIFDLQAKHIRDVEEILKSVARYPDCPDVVQQAIINIVQSSTKSQSVKGILTAGPWTSMKYSWKKVIKMSKGFSTKKSVVKNL